MARRKGRRPERRRRWWRKLLVLAAGITTVLAAWCLVDLLRIRSDLAAGQDSLIDLDPHTIDQQGGLDQVVDKAADHLDAANRRARRSIPLRVLSVIPGIGGQVDALRDMTHTAQTVGGLGRHAAGRMSTAIDSAQGNASGRITLVETMLAAIDELKAGLEEIDVGAKGWLLPPLASARTELVDHLDAAKPKLDDARNVSQALRSFLEGPRKYLLIGGNNAEMRALAVTTTAGAVTIENGNVTVGDFHPTADINLPYPGVPVPDDIANLYGWLGPGQAYTSAVMTPNFPVAAEIAHRISPRNVIGPVDGVIYTDTVTLQALLLVTGPVTVDGITYHGYNAAAELINRNYFRFPTSAEAEARRSAHGDVAKAVFEAMNERSFSVTRLGVLLADLARSRHLLGWSANPTENEIWERLSADGATKPENLVITSQDLGGSKLDFYVTIAADATVARRDQGGYRISLNITLTNPTKDGPLPAYIAGNSVYAKPGEYGTFLAVSFPAAAFEIVAPYPTAREGPDGPLQVRAVTTRVPEGTSNTLHFEFSMPEGSPSIEVLPSTRLAPIEHHWNGRPSNDKLPIDIELDELPSLESVNRWPAAVAAGLLLIADVYLLRVVRRHLRSLRPR